MTAVSARSLVTACVSVAAGSVVPQESSAEEIRSDASRAGRGK